MVKCGPFEFEEEFVLCSWRSRRCVLLEVIFMVGIVSDAHALLASPQRRSPTTTTSPLSLCTLTMARTSGADLELKKEIPGNSPMTLTGARNMQSRPLGQEAFALAYFKERLPVKDEGNKL